MRPVETISSSETQPERRVVIVVMTAVMKTFPRTRERPDRVRGRERKREKERERERERERDRFMNYRTVHQKKYPASQLKTMLTTLR